MFESGLLSSSVLNLEVLGSLRDARPRLYGLSELPLELGLGIRPESLEYFQLADIIDLVWNTIDHYAIRQK